MQPVATLLDHANQSSDYTAVLQTMVDRLHDNSLTPAAILLAEMSHNHETYFRMAMRKAQEHRDYFQQRPPTPDLIEKYQRLASESLVEQQQIEAASSNSFDEFLADYLGQRAANTEPV